MRPGLGPSARAVANTVGRQMKGTQTQEIYFGAQDNFARRQKAQPFKQSQIGKPRYQRAGLIPKSKLISPIKKVLDKDAWSQTSRFREMAVAALNSLKSKYNDRLAYQCLCICNDQTISPDEVMQVIKANCKIVPFSLYTACLKAKLRCKNVIGAYHIWMSIRDQLHAKHPSSSYFYELMIRHLARLDLKIAARLMDEMHERGMKISQQGLVAMLNGYAQVGNIDAVWALYEFIKTEYPVVEDETVTTLIYICSKTADLDRACRLYSDHISNGHTPSSRMFSALVRAFAQRPEYHKQARELVRDFETNFKEAPPVEACIAAITALYKSPCGVDFDVLLQGQEIWNKYLRSSWRHAIYQTTNMVTLIRGAILKLTGDHPGIISEFAKTTEVKVKSHLLVDAVSLPKFDTDALKDMYESGSPVDQLLVLDAQLEVLMDVVGKVRTTEAAHSSGDITRLDLVLNSAYLAALVCYAPMKAFLGLSKMWAQGLAYGMGGQWIPGPLRFNYVILAQMLRLSKFKETAFLAVDAIAVPLMVRVAKAAARSPDRLATLGVTARQVVKAALDLILIREPLAAAKLLLQMEDKLFERRIPKDLAYQLVTAAPYVEALHNECQELAMTCPELSDAQRSSVLDVMHRTVLRFRDEICQPAAAVKGADAMAHTLLHKDQGSMEDFQTIESNYSQEPAPGASEIADRSESPPAGRTTSDSDLADSMPVWGADGGLRASDLTSSGNAPQESGIDTGKTGQEIFSSSDEKKYIEEATGGSNA